MFGSETGEAGKVRLNGLYLRSMMFGLLFYLVGSVWDIWIFGWSRTLYVQKGNVEVRVDW